MSLLIKNGKIITMGDDPKIIENGSIYIKMEELKILEIMKK